MLGCQHNLFVARVLGCGFFASPAAWARGLFMNEPTTPLMQQYHAVKKQHPGALLLFRLGDFYELFYDDAVVASRLLQITLTARNKEKGQAVPMCGVPYHAAENYIARLIKAGHKVAICEQMEVPGPGKKIVRREVIRVLTPGTASGTGLVGAKENNYLAAVARSAAAGAAAGAGAQTATRGGGRGAEPVIGLAFVDLSTGEFRATEFSGEKAEARLRDELGILRPREVLLSAGGDSISGDDAGGDGWIGRGGNAFGRVGVRGELRDADAGAALPGCDFGRIWIERACVRDGCCGGAGALFARDFGDWGADAGRFGHESVVASGGGGAGASGSALLITSSRIR